MRIITKCLSAIVGAAVLVSAPAPLCAQPPHFPAIPGVGLITTPPGVVPFSGSLLHTVEGNAMLGLSYQALWGSGNAFWGDVAATSTFGTERTVNLNPYSRFFDNNGAGMQGHADAVNGRDKFLFDPAPGNAAKGKAGPDNGRRALDEFLYEGDHEGTAAEEQERLRLQGVRRSLAGPSTTEVLTGRALNDLLGELKLRLGKPAQSAFIAPDVRLDQIDWKRINVTSAPGAVTMAILRDDGALVWPSRFNEVAFLGLRRELTAQVAEAVRLAKSGGQVPVEMTQQLATDVERLSNRLKAIAPALTFDQYSESKSFVNHLESAIKGLQRPDAGNYFNGKYALTCKTVPDLVRHMNERGLSFTDALPGDEAAYKSLHHALVTYSNSLIAQTGGL
jgi:hypothetical protein